MERIILESIFLSTVIFLVLFYIKLFRNVIYFRGKEKIALGHGNSEQLRRAISAHSNFNENVPLGLILSMFLYFHNYLFLCSISLIILSIGRFLHAKGINDVNEKDSSYNLRRKGMKLTIYSYKIAILGIVYFLLQSIYFFTVNIK